jgi:hypothetical protein
MKSPWCSIGNLDLTSAAQVNRNDKVAETAYTNKHPQRKLFFSDNQEMASW